MPSPDLHATEAVLGARARLAAASRHRPADAALHDKLSTELMVAIAARYVWKAIRRGVISDDHRSYLVNLVTGRVGPRADIRNTDDVLPPEGVASDAD